MDELPTLTELEAQVGAEAVREDPESHAMVEGSLDLFSEAIGQLAGLKAPTEGEHVAYGMVVGAFYCLVAAHRLLVTGYYRQAAILERAALEDAVTCNYVWKHPDKVNLWLEAVEWRSIPRFREMLADLEPKLGERWRQTYGTLSEFTHPRGAALAEIEAQLERGALRPYFDKKHFFAFSRAIVEIALFALAAIPFLNGAISRSGTLGREFDRLLGRFETWSTMTP
jgi:hypothetical protein